MRKIIIAPSSMHQDLINQYRQDNAFFDVSLISKEELLEQWKGYYDNSAIITLMKEGMTYQLAKEILSYLPYVNHGDTEHLRYLELLKDKLTSKRNYHLNQFFDKNEVEIYGYSDDDNSLNSLIKYFHIHPIYHLNRNISSMDVFQYDSMEDECYGVLNNIASLIAQGIDINDIYIYCQNEEYLYYLNRLSKGFHFTVDLSEKRSYLQTELAKEFISLFKQEKNLQNTIKLFKNSHQNDDISILENLLNDDLLSLDFPYQLDFITNELKHYILEQNHYKNAVKVISAPRAFSSKYVFVIGFVQGVYPKSFKDSKYLNDEELEKIGLNTSFVNTKISEDTQLSFLASDNHFKISYPLKSLSAIFYPSSFVYKHNFSIVKANFPEVIYSEEMAKFYLGVMTDKYVFFKEASEDFLALKSLIEIPYQTYDNSFSGVHVYDNDTDLKLSYSAMKTYHGCPFAYYSSTILGLDTFDENIHTKIGTVAHAILSCQYNDDFDFDTIWDEQIKLKEWSCSEMVLLDALKEKIRCASNVCLSHHAHVKDPKYRLEETLYTDIDKHTLLKGTIDKTIIINGEYLVLVDYKTNSESFDMKELEYGYSMQLPTYAYLALSQKKYVGYKIIGLFINNILDKSLKTAASDNSVPSYLKLKGCVIDDMSLITLLDSTFEHGESEYINGVKVKKDGGLYSSNAIVNENEMNSFVDVAKKYYVDCAEELRANNFAIAPKYLDDKNFACTYCPFRDLCFRKNNQIVFLKEAIEEEENQ